MKRCDVCEFIIYIYKVRDVAIVDGLTINAVVILIPKPRLDLSILSLYLFPTHFRLQSNFSGQYSTVHFPE